MSIFGIQIQDESRVMSEIAVEQNTSTVQLYDWQRRAIDFFFENDCKVIYEVATGCGKSFCAIEIIKRVLAADPDACVLIVVPKNIILEDTWFKELYNNGFSLRDIGVFYGLAKEYCKITITNMQSLSKVALDYFDMIILDEIHNYATARLLPIIAHPFKYRIGLSATIQRMDNAHWKLIEMFNYNVFKYTPQEALSEGILNPFDFVNVGVDMDEQTFEKYTNIMKELNVILQMGGGFKKIMRGNSGLKFRMLAKMNERNELIFNYERKFDVIKKIDDKVIVFNERNSQTNKCYWYLLDIGIKACVVHSGVPKEKREQNMIDFKNDKYNVILASRVLDEGWNLPAVGCAIIAAGNSTARQCIQRMGRVLRRKKKQSSLYQIYCNETVEQTYAANRSILFKDLCSKYSEYNYKLTGELEI